MNNEIDKALGVVEKIATPMSYHDTPTESRPIETTGEDIDDDYKYQRDNFYNLVEKGSVAIEGILELAKEGEHPRAYGVDTPESRTSDPEEKVYGLAAKHFVESYLPKDSRQVLRTRKDSVGKYGRILGEFVVFDGSNDRETTLNQLLIDTHNAVEYFGQSKEDIAEEHIKNRSLVILENHE